MTFTKRQHDRIEIVAEPEFYQVKNFIVYDAGLTNKFVSTITTRQQDSSSRFAQQSIFSNLIFYATAAP